MRLRAHSNVVRVLYVIHITVRWLRLGPAGVPSPPGPIKRQMAEPASANAEPATNGLPRPRCATADRFPAPGTDFDPPSRKMRPAAPDTSAAAGDMPDFARPPGLAISQQHRPCRPMCAFGLTLAGSCRLLPALAGSCRPNSAFGTLGTMSIDGGRLSTASSWRPGALGPRRGTVLHWAPRP
jgi:hypothetical protein